MNSVTKEPLAGPILLLRESVSTGNRATAKDIPDISKPSSTKV
jgi:hypothetical protein